MLIDRRPGCDISPAAAGAPLNRKTIRRFIRNLSRRFTRHIAGSRWGER